LPSGEEGVDKSLSDDPDHYADAPTEGIRRILARLDRNRNYDSRADKINTSQIGSIRMGTTVATNALLERQGAPTALLTTKGFGDLLEIGNQARPQIFDLTCRKPGLLYTQVVEVDERVTPSQFYTDHSHGFEKGKRITGEYFYIHNAPCPDKVKQQLKTIRNAGITSLAINFCHGYTFDKHEQMVADLVKSMHCFDQISTSQSTSPMAGKQNPTK
jgi:5-oxoprolinase (ATP-hydrolysing)